MATQRQLDTRERRLDCIESFLRSPTSAKLQRPINGSQFHYNGEGLYTKDPSKASDLNRAIIGRWIEGKLHLYNTKSSLGKDTLKRASDLELDYVVHS